MSTKKIAILYIATGPYTIFWEDFYNSSEKYFTFDNEFEKHYVVFSDRLDCFPDKENIHKYNQNNLPWPYTTLLRFNIFNKARDLLEEMDYIYFFNANMLFSSPVSSELLPKGDKSLVLVRHPGFYNRKREQYTYESNPKSLAFIPDKEGEFYFMGGLNGGKASNYLDLIDTLSSRVKSDFYNGIVAIWHDESHLNRYAVDKFEQIQIMSPEYGFPSGATIPFDKKIIIRDKNEFGGHDTLRNKTSVIGSWFNKVKFEYYLRKYYDDYI